jgi:phospholipase/carboxylesterase
MLLPGAGRGPGAPEGAAIAAPWAPAYAGEPRGRMLRHFLTALLLLAGGFSAAARSPEFSFPQAGAPAAGQGVQALGNGAFLYRPGTNAARRPVLVLLHGAGMSGRAFLDGLRSEADRCGCLLLSVQSGGATWDTVGLVARAGAGKETPDRLYGADVGRVERALSSTLKAADADKRSVVLAGFSDGASYALSLGMANPQIFRGVVAIAPGFHLEPAAIDPRQRLFVAHSPQDRILPFERTRDATVAPLKRAGFDIRFRAFAGGHRVDRKVLAEGVDFVLGRSTPVPRSS